MHQFTMAIEGSPLDYQPSRGYNPNWLALGNSDLGNSYGFGTVVAGGGAGGNGAGNTYHGQEAYDVLQNFLNPASSGNSLSPWMQANIITPALAGIYAHAAMANFFNTNPFFQANWFAEKTQSIWKWDLKLRPDLHWSCYLF